MAVKHFAVEGLGTIAVYKRRGSQSIRLSVSSSGQVRVVIPAWAPFATGTAYAQKQQARIAQHMPAPVKVMTSGQAIGKSHQLLFMRSTVTKPQRRVRGNTIFIRYPTTMAVTDPAIQELATKASTEALRDEAEALLPGRLQSLAVQYGFTYKNVSVKKLKSRWGSCDSKGQIVLNLYLMQLPWALIDYVLLHELTHTKHMNHGDGFWGELQSHLPHAKKLRKQMKAYQTMLQT